MIRTLFQPGILKLLIIDVVNNATLFWTISSDNNYVRIKYVES
jgi:hypothetical protein